MTKFGFDAENRPKNMWEWAQMIAERCGLPEDRHYIELINQCLGGFYFDVKREVEQEQQLKKEDKTKVPRCH